jgi:phosphoenolpyruvate synthase/pyruvate phosphate dikinase
LTEEEVRTEVMKKMGKKKVKLAKAEDPKSIPSELLNIGKDMVKMQDERKMYMMKAAFYLHEHLKMIGSKYNVPVSLMMQTLPSEVMTIGRNASSLKEELKLRQRSCVVTGSLGEGIKTYTGEAFLPEGLNKEIILEVRGRVACGGKAAGRAKIIRTIKDIYKVNHGDIIVSPMTSPELVPAIRRCVAIVTDFGGITCHAAIVSREFNIPCIVGTENATKLIKDKDLVEVDADSGIVRVLESGE